MIACCKCGAEFAGGRDDARRAGWEPWSSATQAAADRGPMVCVECIAELLEEAAAAMKAWPASGGSRTVAARS